VDVSVIIPTRGDGRWLMGCLASVARQSGNLEIEVCLVNDGGPDLEPVLAKFPDLRIRYERFPYPKGQVAARNAALNMVSGRYIAFLDDDDRWLPAHLAELVRAQRHGPVLAYTDVEVVWLRDLAAGPRPVRRMPLAWQDAKGMLRAWNPIPPSAVLYPASWHNELGAFDTRAGHYWDWDWWLRAAASHPFVRVPQALTLYAVREDGGNESARPELMRPDLDYLIAKHGLGPLPSSNFARMATDPVLASQCARTDLVWDGTNVWHESNFICRETNGAGAEGRSGG
jgi:glycosyltransferase involved in cell wall biosynthesis